MLQSAISWAGGFQLCNMRFKLQLMWHSWLVSMYILMPLQLKLSMHDCLVVFPSQTGHEHFGKIRRQEALKKTICM